MLLSIEEGLSKFSLFLVMEFKLESASNFVDAHCHIDLFKHPEMFAISCQTTHTHTIAVTNAPSVFFYTEKLALDNEFLYPSVGLHPELCKTHKNEIGALLEIIPRVKCVGEIGLDYVDQDKAVQSIQRDVLKQILEKCADVGGRVLSVHSRRAASDTIAMIGDNFPGHVILHWFSGSDRDARRGIANGYYFSVNCAMARSESGKKILRQLPKERVITESDAPFHGCCSERGQKYAHHAVSELLNLWNCSYDEAVNTIYNNFKTLMSLD